MSYQPRYPPFPDPRSCPGFEPELWPSAETALPEADLPTAILFQRAYYAVNLAIEAADPAAFALASHARDALDDAVAPFGFLVEPARQSPSGTVRSLTFATARLRASGRLPPLFARIATDEGTGYRDATPIPPALAALAPRETCG